MSAPRMVLLRPPATGWSGVVKVYGLGPLEPANWSNISAWTLGKMPAGLGHGVCSAYQPLHGYAINILVKEPYFS